MEIWPLVCSRECSCCFLRLRALRAARYSDVRMIHSFPAAFRFWCAFPQDPVFWQLSDKRSGIPVLFVVTFSLAISSCFAIWFSKCLSLFCSISSCCRRSSIAFLGASFLFCPPLPPNQAPHILRASWESFDLKSPNIYDHLAANVLYVKVQADGGFCRDGAGVR